MKIKVLENKIVKILNYKVKILHYAIMKKDGLIEVRYIKNHLKERLTNLNSKDYMLFSKSDIKKLNEMIN